MDMRVSTLQKYAMQELLNNAEKSLSGFSSKDGAGILFMLSQLLKEVSTRAADVANWPNVSSIQATFPFIQFTIVHQPFHSVASTTFTESNSSWLELIDGGLNLENVPLGPLFVRARGLDTIVAVDGSADETDNWPK
jgi:lysophospholipase